MLSSVMAAQGPEIANSSTGGNCSAQRGKAANSACRKRQRGTVMVLTLVIFLILSILGLAYHRVTQGVRRDAQRTYYRLHATTALENALLEGKAIFLAKANKASIDYRKPPPGAKKRKKLSKNRRHRATGGNDAAFEAFMKRHGGKVSSQAVVENSSTTEGDSMGFVSGGADPWYDAFRSSTNHFKESCPVPYARQLMGRTGAGIEFEKFIVRVISVEEPSAKENRFLLKKGVLAISATLKVSDPKISLRRSLEKRYRFSLRKMRAPKWVGGGKYSLVSLLEPPVATFLNVHGKEAFK